MIDSPRALSACAVLVAAMAFASTADAAGITILHTFTGGAADGTYPTGLLLDGSVLYGTTSLGGLTNAGTIYHLNTDGSNFGLLHALTYPVDGYYPQGNLIRSGTTLYGTTGGANGSVYKIETDGSSFNTLTTFPFPATSTSPRTPEAGVVLSRSTLFGTTTRGGSNQNLSGASGTIFSIGTDGSGLTPIHEFPTSVTDGSHPQGITLTVAGQTIYGMTTEGGTIHGGPFGAGQGIIFRVNADGSGYTVLHEFTGRYQPTPVDGGTPLYTGMQLVGNRLYGVTGYGGLSAQNTWNQGVVFGIDTDGSNFQVLHSFGDAADGARPSGGLAISGSTLYGTTRLGGAYGRGTIYQVNLDGTGYSVIHDFAGGPNDAAEPFDSGLIVSGNTLYGTTTLGGTYDLGVVYSLVIPEPSAGALLTSVVIIRGMLMRKRSGRIGMAPRLR